MPQWLLSTSMFSDRADGLFHAALPRADAVGAAEDRGGRHRRCFRERPAEPAILFVGAAAARHLIDAPGVGCLRIAGERTAKRDHRAHAVRHHLGELTRIEAAKAPSDQADLAPMVVAELMHQIDHRVLHAFAQAEIAALPPAADGIAAVLQEAAQRPRRGVGRDQARQAPAPDGRRPSARDSAAAMRRETRRTHGWPALQKHQGSGRRAQRLGSGGHRISSPGGASSGRLNRSIWKRGLVINRSAMQQSLNQAMTLIPSFKRVSSRWDNSCPHLKRPQ